MPDDPILARRQVIDMDVREPVRSGALGPDRIPFPHVGSPPAGARPEGWRGGPDPANGPGVRVVGPEVEVPGRQVERVELLPDEPAAAEASDRLVAGGLRESVDRPVVTRPRVHLDDA